MGNVSVGALLTLSGLSLTQEQRVALFVATLLWYLLIVFGNVTIVVVVVRNKSLHEPMYVFLCNLCVNALYGTLGFYPKFLLDLLFSQVVSYAGCLLQGFVIHSSTCGDFSILTVMALDRYVAICRPLRYHSLMTKQRVCVCVFLSWLVPLLSMFMNTATLLGRALCGSHVPRLYCVNWMVASLACSPSRATAGVAYFNLLFYFGHFLFVLWSYVSLIRTCLSSSDNSHKFLHTCVPHLACLLVHAFSVLLDLLYLRFGSSSLNLHLRNFMALEFLLIPPLANPLIYGLKLRQIHTQLLKRGHARESQS